MRWCARPRPARSTDQVQVVYVSPLKALSNDIRRNLEQPLAGCIAELGKMGLPATRDPQPGAHRRHTAGRAHGHAEAAAAHPGDHARIAVPAADQRVGPQDAGHHAQRRSSTRSTPSPPPSAARTWRCRWSAWRICAGGRLQRVGLSATQKPIEEVARFLVGTDGGDCAIVDSGHVRQRDIALVLPDSPLEAVMSTEVWNTLYDQHGRADQRAPHHADLRQHPPHGGTRDATPVRTHRRGDTSRRTTAASPRSSASTPSSA